MTSTSEETPGTGPEVPRSDSAAGIEPLHQETGLFSDRGIGLFITIASAIAFVASFTLMWEEVELLKNPDHEPGCNFSILMSCSSAMLSEQGAVFGFPNPMLGIAGFALLLAIGVAAAAGGRLPRWYWVGATAGLTFAFGMVNWFAYQAIFVMGVLCPWCMVVWAMTVPMFWYTVLHVAGKFTDSRVVLALRSWHLMPVFLWFFTVIGLIFFWFWDYYWSHFFATLFG